MSSQQTVTILGAGYVGLTTASLLANSGCKVYLVEPNQKRLEVIKSGKSFFYEFGLDSLVKKAVDKGTLIPTDSYQQSVPNSELIFSCVGTPDNPDGSSNLSFVFSAAKETAELINKGAIYIQKSTVPVGTGKEVSKVFTNKQISYVSNPEFLREGTALFDALYFDRVVVGSQDKEAANKVLDLYKKIQNCRRDIAEMAGISSGEENGKYILTGLDSAELIKVTANAFLALKISFTNSIAKLADQTGADIKEVMDAVGSDRRIGREFLNAGRGYGGGCFPKDVSGLISSAQEHGVDMSIMQAATEVNEEMPGYIATRVQESLGSLNNMNICILGLAFKAGTSDARRSPAIALANTFADNASKVSAYDPQASNEAKDELDPKVTIYNSLERAAENADAVVIATDWPEFKQIRFKQLANKMRGNLLVDAVNCLEISKVTIADLQYIGVGRSQKSESER